MVRFLDVLKKLKPPEKEGQPAGSPFGNTQDKPGAPQCLPLRGADRGNTPTASQAVHEPNNIPIHRQLDGASAPDLLPTKPPLSNLQFKSLSAVPTPSGQAGLSAVPTPSGQAGGETIDAIPPVAFGAQVTNIQTQITYLPVVPMASGQTGSGKPIAGNAVPKPPLLQADLGVHFALGGEKYRADPVRSEYQQGNKTISMSNHPIVDASNGAGEERTGIDLISPDPASAGRDGLTDAPPERLLNSPYSRAMAQMTRPPACPVGRDADRAEQSPHTPLNISDIIKAQETQGIQKALELYDSLLLLSRLLLEQIDKEISLKSINLKSFTGIIREMVSLIVNGDRGLLDLIYRSSKDNYLIAHLVNTCIISLEIGKGMDYNPSRLEELGLGAFLHDVGMQEVLPLIYHRDKLSRDEYERVKMHVMDGVNLLKEIANLPPAVLDVCAQHHERITGKGYRGLSGKAINEYAQIIGLADTFEAITHSRPYRRQKSGQAAIKELIETSNDSLNRKALKVLVKRIGIYPVGTWVALNTGEIARVVRVNEIFPIRPIVTVIMPVNNNTPVETKTIDLAKNQNVYIRATMDEEELISKIPR